MQITQPLEASVDQVDIGLRRSNPGFGLLFEDVQDIHAAGPPDGVDGSKCITGMVHDDLQRARITVAAQRFRPRMFVAPLRLKEGLADGIAHILMEGGKVPFCTADPNTGLILGGTAVRPLCLNWHKWREGSFLGAQAADACHAHESGTADGRFPSSISACIGMQHPVAADPGRDGKPGDGHDGWDGARGYCTRQNVAGSTEATLAIAAPGFTTYSDTP
jgi:hypothetical protein